MADKDNKSKLTYHVWDKDNNEYDIPDEVVQQRGMDNFAKDFEGGYITMFDDKKQKVDVPIEDVGEYRKQGYIWYDTSGNATPINEVGKKPSPSSSSQGTEQSQYPQKVLDAFNSPDNKPGNFKDLAQLNDEYQRGELKKPSLISQALGMMPKVDAGNIGREQKMGGMITSMLLGGNEQQAHPLQQPQDNNQQVQQTSQVNATQQQEPAPSIPSVVNDNTLMDAKFANYLEDWKKRPDKEGNYFENFVADLEADGMNPDEALEATRSAQNRYANRSAIEVTNKVVSALADDTVQDAEKNIEAQWYSHDVQDKLKQEASAMGISYDDYVAYYLKPAMVESLVQKYGQNYRNIAEGIATRLYSHDEHVQDRLMNQDIDEALSSVISKYVNPSVVEEYNKAQEEGSKAFNEGMEGSQNIPASLRLGTAIASQYEANQAKDPQKTLSALQKKFNGLYKNPQFLNDMSNAAFKVMQRYGMNGTLSGNPKQFKPMIDEVLKAQLNQLEVKNMIPKGSAEYIMNTGLGNTIVGKITRKLVQTDYQNWLEDMANQQYQPGFWERVGSGALTFAGDAWSYWLPGAAGGKVTKSMLAKAEGRLASDLMAKGMEAKMAERAAKVLIGKSRGMALKTGAAHGAVTFGGQSAISKPIDEIYRTGQLDENGKVYNPSVGKILANTLGEVAKQSAVGAIMQGGTIANMVGKGRGLATNILADVGGKVVDSSIMTGQQMLERMAHDPNFKPTGKDFAESALESMANLVSIGLPGMVGKYARFKDAKEFNRKFDFNDRDIAELKRFGYDDLRDAFEKLGINGYRAEGDGVQMMGQLTDKYMNLMNDKSVPEVLKAKMMAVVEGKRPSSFSPVIDSIIVQPMDNDGKVYLETLNKDGGIIDRKEYSSLEEAQKAEKKLDFEKSLNITSEYEKAYHTDALQDRLNTVYEQARDRYAAGEQLNDEDKAAIYLHQNASAIGDIMQKQQKGMKLTEQEQQMVNSYRHFYDSAFENSPIMKEYVRTFEDSQGVEHGTLRKALEGDGKSRTAEQQKLVEEYQKQLYNDIVLKREMNDAKEQMNQNLIEGQRELPGATQEGGASAENAEATAEKPVDASVSSDVLPTEPPTPPVGGETPSNVEGTPSVENGSSPSDATTASNESKSDAYVMGQNAYQNGDAEGLKAIDHNDDVSKARLKRAFADNEAMMDVVVKAYEEGKDMEQFVALRANSMTPAQQNAVRKYVEAQDAKKGVYDALQHADDGYGDALKELLWTYQTEDGNIVPATLTTGQQVFLKKANEYGGGFVVVPDEDGNPAIKQVSSAEIKEVGTPITMDDYINQQVTEQKNARQQQFFAQYDGSGLKPSDTVQVAMEAGEEPMQMTFAGYSEDGKIVLSDGKDNIALTKDEFNAWRKNALDSSVGAELDAEDAQRANDDAAKAEADKKQRYNEGIVGLGMGQPDYSSKDTEPKVAAEYLQEQFGNDHGKLMNLISGSRSDIKEQLDNKRKAASEYEDWLSLNADLDPEKAQKVENDLALVNEQIADLETRYKNWNAIRKEVMTPEEARTLKNERKAEIENAGVDDSVGSPSDEREVAVLDNKELKKQYPTMDEASNYIASERKRIYHIQNDEVQPQIDDINEALEQYMNGDIDYSADQLKELNTTKAQLEARQANLSASAKDLKAQDKLLNTLYSAENKEERAKAMEELTPSEQRKVLVADALKKNDLGSIKEIYKDASIDVMDLTPQTLEEAVSESLSPHSLNPESLQYELGKSNFKFGIGKRYDSNKFNYLIAKKGTGMSVNEFAVRVFNDLPVNLQDMGYTDQDVRNTLLDMFKTYDNVKEMRNVALMNRIAAAEEELSAEEEWYEAQKEREIIERQAEIEEYNSYIQDKTLSLPSESELNAIEGMEYDRMMEAEEREREYKEYVKSILPEIADYDDRSNEEGYGGGGGLGSDSSRRGVDEGNRQGEEISGREASSQSETGESTDSGRTGRQETGSMERGEGSVVRGAHLPQEASFGERLKNAIAETEPNPSEAQKKAGNYKKGHLSFGGYDFTVETPKGTTRSGKDEQGKPWSVTMHDTYGYILGKIGVDGDHIDMFINDAADLDSFDGNVYVVDQVNPETGEFDEHKVLFGYPSEEAATEAYLANYSKDWKGLGKVTAVPKATFDKWLESSDRKTKPFADYAMIKKGAHQDFISDMEYTYENDVHPSEEDKPKMQKFAERLLNFHQDREDKPEYGYTVLSSNINGDKLYPSEKKWFGTKKYRQGVSWVDKDNVCAYELNPRFNARGYLTAVGVHKLVPLASFDRDVKEVKPSEMTEAQKVAYDAVSTMLKKAGIPVKVVSNEDMEKVAEEQDNLAISMLMSDPQLRFNIKTPEQKKAAKAAYDWATEHRPDKYAQYAIVNMDNPNQMPEYFEKKSLAEQWRKYYTNAWRIGNYKAFDLNKPFEEQVKNVKGDVPSEFDPYKVDAQNNKRNELKKQIKEAEDAYNSTGQERNNYQIQLMKEYMDEHGLASENDIPDDVWSKLNDKAHEKYQDKLDSLFAKYKDLDRQLKAIVQPGVQYLKGKGVVYGYTDGKEIVLNQEHLNPNTPIHEYQHLWRTAAKNMNPELIEHGDKLIMQTQLFADLKEDPNYKHLSDEQICDEAFARLTGEDGAAILEQMAKDAIKENPLDTAKELSVINKLKEWLKKFWYWTLETFTKWKPEDIKKMTLEDIRNLVLRDLAQGVDPRTVLKGQMTKDEAVSLRQQMADNAEPERILEHTEDNWLQDFGKDGRVNTPIGSIKLGENQYKKAGREDRIKRFGLLKPTLERPDVILEKPAPKEGAERQTKYLFVKSFKKVDGTKILNFESITVKQGEDEVSISAHQIEPSKLLKELTESKMLWNRFRGDSNSLGENQGSALTPSANNPSGKDSVLNPHSDAKIRNSFEITKENGGNLSVEDKIKAVSQQFGVDEADVAMYANAIKKGSTAEAARARANIKRHLMQVNEGNIFSFEDVVKYTKPINEALKENFGDLDAMIEEQRKQVEAERNAMEAARKRAEEEEAKRKKHLEELSLIPDDKLDKQYMDALAKGDDATAREMLDEAARRKGYDDTESAYQGVGAWAAPGNPGYESDKARRDDWESSGSDVNLEDMALGYTPQPDDYFSHPERYSQNTPHGLESVKAINTAIDAIKNGEKDVKVKVYRAVPTSVKEGKLRNGDWVTPSKKYAEMHGTNRLEGKYRIIEDEVPANQLWWDGNDANEFGFDDGKAYKYKNAKNNRKLNDLVTYDDKGDVIPPSKRFNSRKSDIRFMFGGEKGAAEADKADEQTIRMDNLDIAKQMEEAKKDAKIIKMATGWEKGVDGKWRYEMPDAKIKDTIDVGGGNIVKRFEEDMLWTDGKLEDAVDAPKLFEAYPQLKNIKIHTDAVMNDMPSNGEYNPQTKTITIHADELKYLNSILNHEIQHVIQHEEGFAHGGTPEQVERDFNAAKAEWKARSYAFELEEKAKEMGGEYNQSAVEKALIQEYKDMDMPEFIPDKETRIKGFNYFARGYADRSMDDAIKRFRLDRFQRTDFDSYQEYRKLAGEVEARNVQKRLGMTDEERRNSLASETEDVNRDEQIVMNGSDASYSIVKDPETIKKLDKEDTVKVYRAMQVGEDGKLYPPMAAKVKGKFVEPIELGKWEQADERPELADDKGMFTLNKGNGKSLKAAYNPYLHTSRTPLNDQFSEAQNRPNIVTVEVEVPKSELTSGYKADKAKDAVGEVEWKAGIIQGQLTGKRKVVLSRWDKPVRIVPDSEVADVIVNDMFKGKNITMPSNVVTPSLRKELEKRGVPFVETDNRGRIVGGENDGVHYSKVYGKNAQSPILEQKLKKHPDSLMKAGTYFSGGGLVEEGLKGIIDPVVAVEYDRKISGVYRNNFGQHIVTADVRDVDPKELVKHIDGEVEYFHASPVCKNYSQAKSNGGEVELDKETAKSTADFIDAVKPRVVTIENVKDYKDSEAMKIITQALDKNGYKWDADVYNAADFGGYTSRERLIVRAVKDGELPEKPKKQPRKGGWLEAVEDILPTLTEKKSGVAPWMDARLKVDGIDWQKVEKPLYVMGSAYADGKIPHAYGDEILPTLRTKSGDVIIMPGGKVLRADGRVLARITGLGDDYLLPKTESLAHTIIGNGIPVQLTKGVIAPLLNKDDLSGRNVLARLGSSIFKNNWDADMQKQVSDRVVNTANKLGGAEATVYTSVDEVPDAYLSDVKNGATGWYDPTTHTVHVYLPNCADADEAQRTVFHEKIGHEGMEVLLGGEQGVRKFADFVYKSVDKKTRGKILDFAHQYDPGWNNPDRINIGTQEYIAHLAEEGPTTAEDFSLWTKIKHYLIKVLKKLGVRVPALLNDKDLRYYLMKAGKALHVWDNMPKTQQEAMMAQASNAEIKDALADGAGKGKPRQKKGESAIQYMKRVMEWKRWKEAREDKEDPEPPMFYDFDKDAEGKKEWERLNKEWRDSHGLRGEEMPLRPERKEGESDDAFLNRYKEWEKWNDAMGDKENPMPDMFSFEKSKQDEARQKYEDWLTRHELNEQNDADLDLYEGKIYPAETNPEADALEQEVMQDLAEVTSTDVSKEGAATTVKHAVIHRRKNMEEASADDAIYINDVKNSIEKMAESGAFDKLLSDYQGKPNKAEKLAEAIPYIIEAPRRIREIAYKLNSTGVFGEGHIHITPNDVEAIQELRPQLAKVTAKKHTELKHGKEVELFDDMKGATEVASKVANIINGNHEKEPGFVPIDGTDILNKNVLPIILNRITPYGVDYKNLSEPMKSVLDSIRDWYNYTFGWLKDNNTLKADTGFTVDYVNHLWDKEKSDKNAYAMYVENRQRTKSPNEKPRQINTIMEGLEVGLVPKTTDITKMMAYYSRSNIEAWANKTMLQEVSGLNVIERNEDGEIISSDPLLSSVAPFNLEQYKYFEIPGVGPVWVYNVSPKQMKVKNPITGKDKVLYSEASAGDRFGVVFDTYQSTPFWKAFDTLASSMKKLELGFSGFHAGALTEVYMVQNMVEYGPKKALANFMKYIFADTMKNHQLPCFANPQDFQEAATHLVKFGATNDYAAADVQNMFDNFRDSMMKVQEKLKDGNGISGTVAKATMPLKVATQMLSLINKGMDRALWDFLHDGLKLATYRMRADKTKERAKKKGWTEEELSRALDEDGQFVNDMFGGQHWDVLGASHRTLRYAGRVLLSPDWNASTTRHFLALTGYGSVWNEATLENFKEYYKRLYHKNLTPEDEGRRARQISSFLCYGLGFMVFYEAIANGINAAFRALDEEKERKKAEELRKTNPNYRSPYELAYPDGMKWYDYLMRGNSLGQQSKIFMGRYADGTEMYIRHGKQFREVPEYLFNHKGELEFPGPMVQRMIGKANPMVRMTLDDINYLSDFQASHADQEIQRKYGKTIGLLYKDALYWAPFLIPSQENKEFKAVDFFFPSSKGFSPWKAQSYFKDFILSGDMEGVVMTYQSCERNGIDPEEQIKAAIGSVKALESAEMKDGITSLQEASQRFDAAKSITEKKKMRQKMKKFLSQSDYKAFTQKEALDMVQSYLNGEDDLKEMEKAENKYLMKAKSEDVTEDWRIQAVWNGTMETYDEYQRLKEVDKAKANAFKNSKTNKRLFAARKAISAAKKKMNKAKKQMDGQNDAAKMVEIRKTRKELLKTLNEME
jgi:site-specific DNA-cytosine methylase